MTGRTSPVLPLTRRLCALTLALALLLPHSGRAEAQGAGAWTPIATAGAPSPRARETAVWTGREMIVWGGTSFTGDGARYDPAANAWTPVSRIAAPSARAGHVAVWTGAEMLIWGGGGGPEWDQPLGDGAAYNPASDTWRPISSLGAPSPRQEAAAAWTGTELLVWGGGGASGPLGNGAAYNPATDSWRPLPTAGAPPPLVLPAAAWTGREWIIGGALGRQAARPQASAGSRYDPVTNAWTPLPTAGMPEKWGAGSAVWDGQELLVWDGYLSSQFPAVGARYDRATDAWTPLGEAGAPASRVGFVAVWTGRELLIWGGCCAPSDTAFDDGGRYDPAANTWRPMPPAGVAAVGHDYVAVWTGTQLLVWGGSFYKYTLNTGGRYTPPCRFVLGFAALRAALPTVVGDCLDDERHAANGDGLQHTTHGMQVWRKADNFTAFTDGYHTWVNGPDGVQERLNSQRFAWEANPGGLPVAP